MVRSEPPATTLLVLDDSAEDREILRRLLSSDPRRDYILHERTDIEEAIAACRQVNPDCILLDYSLGDGTGLDFLTVLPEIGGTRAFPVVMLTGSGSEEVAANAFRAGAQDYLVKGTLTPDALQRAIAGAMYKAQTERLLDTQRVELERLFQQAQEANARKDQFLAALSHELRTPLTPILTAVSSINVNALSPGELEDLFSTIRRNVELEARLIDDLLDLTRIAKDKLRLDLHPADAHEVLRHALETCLEDITRKKLKFSFHLEAAEHTVAADPARLQQVFWNLLKNAVKFTPNHGEVRIWTRNSAPGEIQIEVCDTGIGIAPEVLPKIFNAFEQGGAAMTHRFGGLGLGLAISRALVSAHHGQLWAESVGFNQGARFFVTLPTVVPAPSASSVSHEAARYHSGENKADAFSFSKCLIMLVEDHADSARILARVMRRRGYQVVLAASVAEALATFEREEVHALVSDIGLPDGDGVGLMEQLREIRPIPGIALSGYGMEHDLARTRAAGFQEHLTKPIDWPQLDAALVRLLSANPCSKAGIR
jgi:signal transduction histidine kinase